MNQKLYVAQYTNFDYKPGHMHLTCLGIFSNFEDAFRAGLQVSNAKCGNCGETGMEMAFYKDDGYLCDVCVEGWQKEEPEKKFIKEGSLPKTEEELQKLLPTTGCIWGFEWGDVVEWWDGDECGSSLISISSHFVDGDNNDD